MLSPRDYYELVAMHEYKRPHYSRVEEKFINRFIRPLGTSEDDFGNHHLIVGATPPTTMWSCHTDTVHRRQGKQKLARQGPKLRLMPGQFSNCLGADDTAGVWMLVQMIRAKIPGLYVFHRGEEVGCLGSRHFLQHQRKLIDGINVAIAFDRRGKTDIIDHQMGRQCASKAFVSSLAHGLGMGHSAAWGMFTDTATYMSAIPECSNISVGYDDAHWSSEYLDIPYLGRLRDAVLKLDLSSLVVARDPHAIEEPYWKRRRYEDDWEGYGGYSGGNTYTHKMPTAYPNFGAKSYLERERTLTEAFSGAYGKLPTMLTEKREDWRPKRRCVTLSDFCRAYPEEVGDYLESLGVNAADVKDHVDQLEGNPKAVDELIKENS